MSESKLIEKKDKFDLLIIAFTQIISKALDKSFYFVLAFFLYLAFMSDSIDTTVVLSDLLSGILKQSGVLIVSITLNVVFFLILVWIVNINGKLSKENKELLTSKRDKNG